MPDILVEDIVGREIERIEVKEGAFFATEAMKQWPEGFPRNTPYIFGPDMKALLPQEAVARPMRAGETYHIVLGPQGPAFVALMGKVILGVTVGQWLLVGLSLAASVLLAPKMPKMADQGGYEWDEPTAPQFLSGQTNYLQPGSRVPDVFGMIRHYPNLIATPVVENFGDSQTIRELYIVTNGYADVDQIRLSDTDSTILEDFTSTVYTPDDKWPADFPILLENTFVGQTELPAENETLTAGIQWTFNTAGNWTVPVDGYFEALREQVGNMFLLTGDPSLANRGPKRIVSVSTDGRTVTVAPAPAVQETLTAPTIYLRAILAMTGTPEAPLSWATNNNWDTPYINGSGYITGRGSQDGAPSWFGTEVTNSFVVYGLNNGATYGPIQRLTRWKVWIDTERTGSWLYRPENSTVPPNQPYIGLNLESTPPPYNPDVPNTGYNTAIYPAPGDQTVEIWIDIEFPQGLYTQSSGQTPQARTVVVDAYYRAQGSNDPFTTVQMTFTGRTRNPRRWTRKITGLAPGAYEVYLSRVTLANLETGSSITVDGCQWIGLRSVQLSPEFDDLPINYTMIDVSFSTQNQQLAATNRQLNAVVQRYLPDYLGDDPDLVVPTNKMSDAILYTLIEQAGYPISSIDTGALMAIQDTLDALDEDMADGQFNAIIDQAMTAEDQVQSIAAIGRMMVYRRAGTIGFSRNEAGQMPVALFNNRNKTKTEQKTMQFGEANDPDCIIVRFLDQDEDWDEQEFQYPNDITPSYPKTINLLGVTKNRVAWRRAKYEWDRMIEQRDMVVMSATEESIMSSPGDVVAVADGLLEVPPIQGEVQAVSGTTFTFNQPIPAGTYTGRLRDKDGKLIYQTPVTIAASGTVQDIPAWTGAVMPPESAQVGLLYEFASDTQALRELYIVTGVSPDEQNVSTVTLLRYADSIYACDTASMPADPVVVVRKPRFSRRRLPYGN